VLWLYFFSPLPQAQQMTTATASSVRMMRWDLFFGLVGGH
jgi:hypothetical protein